MFESSFIQPVKKPKIFVIVFFLIGCLGLASVVKTVMGGGRSRSTRPPSIVDQIGPDAFLKEQLAKHKKLITELEIARNDNDITEANRLLFDRGRELMGAEVDVLNSENLSPSYQQRVLTPLQMESEWVNSSKDAITELILHNSLSNWHVPDFADAPVEPH